MRTENRLTVSCDLTGNIDRCLDGNLKVFGSDTESE